MDNNNKPFNVKTDKKYIISHNSSKPQNKRDLLKLKIMDKYGISSDKAEKILINIEKRNNTEFNTNNSKTDTKPLIQEDKDSKKRSNVKIDNIKKHQNENNAINNNPQLENNVDSIIENIIPNYNQQISIEVEHVNLTFEVQNEKIDTLKEKFTKILDRKKYKKIKVNALNVF